MTKTRNTKRDAKHERANDILLGALERPLIRWLAEKLPATVMPDHMTLIGFFAAVLIAVSYWLTNFDRNFLWLASFGFVLNWFGDSLDGSLARYRKIERPRFGYFIDHTVDAFTQVIIGVGIGLSPYVRFEFALFVLVGYLLLSIHTYIAIFACGVFKISYGKFGPTEARVLAILINTLIYFVGSPTLNFAGFHITIFDGILLTVGILLIVVYVVSTLKNAVELATQE